MLTVLAQGRMSDFTWMVDHDSVTRSLGLTCSGLGSDHATLDMVLRRTKRVLVTIDCDKLDDNARHIVAGPGAVGTGRDGHKLLTIAIDLLLLGTLRAHHVIAGFSLDIAWWPA